MFTIFLSILFSTSVLAAPVQSNSKVPWSNLKNDKSLARFHSTLLNQTMLTFLNDCYSQNVNVSTKNVRVPCSLYFDAILQLNSTSFVVPQPAIVKLFSQSSTDKEFCKQNHTYPDVKNYPTAAQDFNDRETCGYMCIQENSDGDLVPKPICAFLVWMGEQIKNLSNNATPAVPLAPVKVVSSANVNASHVAVAVSKELVKPEVADAAGKPALPNKAANTQSNISAHTSTKDVSTQFRPQIIIKPEQDSIDRKGDSVVAVIPPAAAVAAEAGVLPIAKEEKKTSAPAKEDQEDSPPPLSPDTQEEERLLPTNQDKHDSLPINKESIIDPANENDSDAEPNEDMDDETEELELKDEKLNFKDPPLVNPDENEGDPKSSQEIVLNTNHVTDPFLEESGSNFFTYFLIGMFLCIVMYVVYHNKSKILALLLEGRRSDKGRSGRRKHTAAYRKLDSNLEEAITSSASGRTTQIIY